MIPLLLALIIVELGAVIYLSLPRPTFTVTLKELSMPIGTVTPGTPATFQATLNQNGTPITLPTGSTWLFRTNDPNATITTNATGDIATITLPTTDTATSITITASTTDSTGATVSGDLTVTVGPGTSTFTVKVVQLS